MIQKEKEDKFMNQKKYKDMLDGQIKANKSMKMYGNMTQMEKRMNRYDLYAYKHNDNNQYCLIPGFNTEKKEPVSKLLKQKTNNYDIMDRLK